MIEIARALEWIHDTLSADATLAGLVSTRIFDGLAPQGSAYPFVVFNHQGGSDTLGVGAVRVLNSGLFQIKVVAQSDSYASGIAIADRIDEVLHGAAGSKDGAYIASCVREQAIMLIEQSNGIEYRHVGGLYRLITYKEP